MQLGVLDFCWLRPGVGVADTLAESVQLAQRVEALGYTRYWLTEHHEPHVAQCTPELVVPLVASRTKSLRVGPAGILLNLHNPLEVANHFVLLESLFPGRIDLGLGRSRCEPARAQAFGLPAEVPPGAEDLYESKLARLFEHLAPDAPVPARPATGARPDIWLLGSGSRSAELAARLGTAFSYSIFLRQTGPDPEVPRLYLDRFRPSAHRREPLCNVAVAGLCAETDVRARARLEGSDIPSSVVPRLVGDASRCADGLGEIAATYGVDEVVFVTLERGAEERARGYELLAAAAAQLPASPVPPQSH